MKASIAFLALYMAVFTFMIGIGLLGTYLPLRMSQAGTAPQVVGLVMAAYFLGMFSGALYCPRLIRLVGHIRAFTAFAAVTAAIVMAHGLVLSPLLWACLRFFAGMSTIGLYTVIESWLNECTPPGDRGRVLAVYMIVSYLGMGTGQFFLNLGMEQADKPLLIAGLALALCIVPVSVTRSLHPEIADFARLDLGEVVRRTPIGLLGCLTAGLLSGAFYSVAPVFCHEIGLSVARLTQIMSVTIFGGLLLQWPIGMLSDRFDRAYMLACIGISVALLAGCVILLADQPFPVFLLLMLVFGGCLFTLYPVSVARAHDLFEPASLIPMSSILLLAFSAGATAGPILATLSMRLCGTPYSFYGYCALVSASFAAIVFFLRGRELVTVVPVDEHTGFVALKSTSPAAVLLDPRLGESAVSEPSARTDTAQ